MPKKSTTQRSEQKGRQKRPLLHDDAFIANALLRLGMNGGNVRLTCRQLNVPQKTLQEWRDHRKPSPARRLGIHAVASAEMKKVAEQLVKLSQSAFAVAQEKVGELDAYRAALVGAISFDKLQALLSSPFLNPSQGGETPLEDIPQERLDELERLLDAQVVEGEVVGSGSAPAIATSVAEKGVGK